MPVKLDVRSFVPEIKELQTLWASRVIDQLSSKTPDLRLLVCLDRADADLLIPERDTRGFFQPNDRYYYRTLPWPDYLATELRTIRNTGHQAAYNYDCVIYVPNRTCEREESLTMTLAHEMTHFIQFGLQWRTWAWNAVVTNLRKETIRAKRLAWKDIPIEFEARLFAKRISEELLGPRGTAEYIESRIEENVNERDVADWKFIKSLDPRGTCNTADMTKALYRRLADIRGKLQKSLDEKKERFPDFRQLDLNEMLPDRANDATV
jgi:hypothetical protein